MEGIMPHENGDRSANTRCSCHPKGATSLDF